MFNKLAKIMTIETFIDKIIIQPTKLCNLDCDYCYLPQRKNNLKMSQTTIKNIAKFIEKLNSPNTLEIIWHMGEPLLAGKEFFNSALSVFKGFNVRHVINTNAILIDDDWCELFNKFNMDVTVSLDGIAYNNVKRLTWNKRPSYKRVIKGINFLQKHKIDFDIICVLHEENINDPIKLYNDFKKLKPKTLGFSIVEKEARNTYDNALSYEVVSNFWKYLFQCWKEDEHSLNIREFDLILPSFLLANYSSQEIHYIELHCTIGVSGDIVILSPEFLDSQSNLYSNFVVGNVNENSNTEIFSNIQKCRYLDHYIDGILKCNSECEYFSYCGGGVASNKFFENNQLSSTETTYCIQSKKALVNSIIENI